MPYDLTEPLVIGIGSRALFNLEQENSIFEEQGLAAQFDIMSVPTLLVISNGKVVNQSVGLKPKNQILQML